MCPGCKAKYWDQKYDEEFLQEKVLRMKSSLSERHIDYALIPDDTDREDLDMPEDAAHGKETAGKDDKPMYFGTVHPFKYGGVEAVNMKKHSCEEQLETMRLVLEERGIALDTPKKSPAF